MASIKFKFDTKKFERDLNKIIEEKNKEINLKNMVVEGGTTMRVLKDTERELLEILISKKNEEYTSIIDSRELPEYIGSQLKDLLSVLKYSGYCASFHLWIGGAQATLTPEGIKYFEREEEYKKMSDRSNINIEQFINNGNNIFGNVFDSNFNIDNSYNTIEKMIDEKGGEDSEELKLVLSDIKEYLENINDSKYISTNKSLFEKIGNHIQKHQWFYQMVVNMLGMAVMNRMGGN